MAILSLVACLCLGATKATSTTEKPRREAVKPHKVVKHELGCANVKAKIIDRRQAAWEWQDRIFMSHTPTTYQERTSPCNAHLQWLARRWATLADHFYRQYVQLQDPERAIRWIFGPYASQALVVAGCESHLHTTAQNGQYLGMFQMGTYARELYGHGPTPLEQAIAAHRYFVASGKDWSPWSCKPW